MFCGEWIAVGWSIACKKEKRQHDDEQDESRKEEAAAPSDLDQTYLVFFEDGKASLTPQARQILQVAGIVATIWVLVTDEGVITGLDPKFSMAPAMNPVPLTVNEKLGFPATVFDGTIDEMLGGGLAPSRP